MTGTRSVIMAVAAARKAAGAIDRYLGGDGDIEQHLAPEQCAAGWIGKEEGFGFRKRMEPRTLTPEIRKTCFETMDLGFDEAMAQCEAGRCLQCDLRLQMEPQTFWSDYISQGGDQNGV
ncbi:MAG: hypothetical protein Q4C52_13610 [Eubacteriales bacterium]|nr:hypothetical protein [Eubacteriales bacterium]